MASKSTTRDSVVGSLPLSDRIETIICPQTLSVNERLTSESWAPPESETKLNFKTNYTFSRPRKLFYPAVGTVFTRYKILGYYVMLGTAIRKTRLICFLLYGEQQIFIIT